ncbi:hypothetical protein BJY04DRAFT_214283 [Aspergillus karnatakaensis]|uniref:uncharacterized protein n=1 Tax=Aspergillus karnatakaensis TaxID=1810916 RepID=UPI003CCDAB11
MRKHLVIATSLVVPAVASSTPEVLCVYPLSGVYAPLQRILFYVLLAFGVIGRRQRWLVAGALASAMTYCGAAAIHSFFLIARARSSVVDLDVYGVFAATSTGIMLTAPLLAWSTTLQTVEREIRTLIILWTILITIGAVLATATIYIRGSTDAPPCMESLVDIALKSVSTLHNSTANCTYVCSPENHPLFRSKGDIIAWKNLLDVPYQITAVFVPTVAASIPSAIITWTWFIRKGHAYLLRPPPAFSRLELGWIGGWLFERRRRNRGSFARLNSVVDAEVRYPWLLRAYQYYFVIGSGGAFVVNLVLNEVRFRSLPSNEAPYEVGQWSPWVGVAMILLAQLITQVLKGVWGEKRDVREDEEEMRMWDTRAGKEEWRAGTFLSETLTFRRRNSF